MKLAMEKTSFLKSSLFKNSAWGVFSNVVQVILISLFFAILARKYAADQFAEFLIATTVYQLVASFSSLGLGQWFIRQYLKEDNQIALTNKFLKTQLGLGMFFYLVNIGLAYTIYADGQIRLLCVILGTNIIFDNFINALKSLNIAEHKQSKTATVLIIDSSLKLLVGCLLFINPFSAVVLSCLMIVVRIITLSLFMKLGSSNTINLKSLWTAKISYVDLKSLVLKNWQFIVIGSISIIYWKIANIIISKALTLQDVADYEIAFRIFYIFTIVPLVASATIFPHFITYFTKQDKTGLKQFYHKIFFVYASLALISYTFLYTFAGLIIPFAFGDGYAGAVLCLQQMALTFLILPTVLLQANLIVSIGLEKMDMWFNITSLVFNVAGCFIGLYFLQSLTVINYSIFISFTIFHVLQDVLLIWKKYTTLKHALVFYILITVLVFGYRYLIDDVNPYIGFSIFCFVLIIATIVIFLSKQKNKKELVAVSNLYQDIKRSIT